MEFKIFNNITPVDGVLTRETRELMGKDRCGNPDVRCVTRECMLKDIYDEGMSDNLRRKKRYAVRNKKWRISTDGSYNLHYYYEKMYNPNAPGKYRHDKSLTPDVVRREVQKGLAEWTKHSGIHFQEASNIDDAEIKILFGSGAHGEKKSKNYFDGQYGVLAHMYFPRNGKMHFDESENYTASEEGPGTNLHYVTAHEMGHGLGIEHSSVEGALMRPYYSGYREEMLHQDDIDAVRSLYGEGVGEVIPLAREEV